MKKQKKIIFQFFILNLLNVWPSKKTVGPGKNSRIINPKGGGGVQNDPLVRRMSVISHMVMLWSQKFLTLSINK